MTKSPLVKGLTPRLPERGKIKIGIKGQWITSAKEKKFQPPKKLDHFLITKTVRGDNTEANFVEDTELMKLLKKKYADPDSKLRRIPIRLLYNDIGLNVQTRYAAYKGRKTLLCTGDGETATKNDGKGVFTERKCPCDHKDPTYQIEHPKETRCKIATRFQCEIIGCEEVGGVFVFRSTGYNTAVELPSSLLYISSMTGGILAGLELMLVMAPRTKEKGDIHVVSVIYSGSRTELKESATKLLESDTMYTQRQELAESSARKLLTSANDNDNPEDITDEFYPEEAKKDVPTDEEMPTIMDAKVVDKETGEVKELKDKTDSGETSTLGDVIDAENEAIKEQKEPEPTKEELAEKYYNDNLADLCVEKPFGGKTFDQLSKANKNWVYKRMTAPPPEIQEAIEQSKEEVPKDIPTTDTEAPEEEIMPTIQDEEETFIDEVAAETTETEQNNVLEEW